MIIDENSTATVLRLTQFFPRRDATIRQHRKHAVARRPREPRQSGRCAGFGSRSEHLISQQTARVSTGPASGWVRCRVKYAVEYREGRDKTEGSKIVTACATEHVEPVGPVGPAALLSLSLSLQPLLSLTALSSLDQSFLRLFFGRGCR